MDALVSTMSHLISVSAFNKGEAGAIFSSVKKTNEPKLVLRRNEPECILISPAQYTKLMEELEDLRDYKLAMERLAANQGKPTISFDEILREEGLSREDLEAMEDVEFE
ncbi:MAG: type II toxin-antitoxin system Phd/YefM family antitoxin [Oscillospiraceae bacterium]|nr:type II toxin-antitoxin system Phd/YefM family antitoxin [Oscillospiraceae bacterium]